MEEESYTENVTGEKKKKKKENKKRKRLGKGRACGCLRLQSVQLVHVGRESVEGVWGTRRTIVSLACCQVSMSTTPKIPEWSMFM